MAKLIPQVGDRVIAVAFDSGVFDGHTISCNGAMDVLAEGKHVGEIMLVNEQSRRFLVKFKGQAWFYPFAVYKQMLRPVIGVEVAGVEFEDREYNGLHFNPRMLTCKNKLGKIVSLSQTDFDVEFQGDGGTVVTWTYPKELFYKMFKRAKKLKAPKELVFDIEAVSTAVDKTTGAGYGDDIVLSITDHDGKAHEITGWKDKVVEPVKKTPLHTLQVPAYVIIDMDTGKTVSQIIESRDVARTELQSAKRLLHKNHKIAKLKFDKFVR